MFLHVSPLQSGGVDPDNLGERLTFDVERDSVLEQQSFMFQRTVSPPTKCCKFFDVCPQRHKKARF
jgi:hypothetical protein